MVDSIIHISIQKERRFHPIFYIQKARWFYPIPFMFSIQGEVILRGKSSLRLLQKSKIVVQHSIMTLYPLGQIYVEFPSKRKEQNNSTNNFNWFFGWLCQHVKISLLHLREPCAQIRHVEYGPNRSRHETSREPCRSVQELEHNLSKRTHMANKTHPKPVTFLILK